MKNTIYAFFLFCFITMGLPSFSQIYLFIDGVKVENSAKGHTDETLIESFSWGVSNPVVTSGGRTTGNKPSTTSLNFTKKRDKISMQLQQATFSGKPFSKAEIRFYKTDGTSKDPYVYLTIFLGQVSVESYQLSGAGVERPVESVSLFFQKIEFEDALQDGNKPAKKTRQGYDILKNEIL